MRELISGLAKCGIFKIGKYENIYTYKTSDDNKLSLSNLQLLNGTSQNHDLYLNFSKPKTFLLLTPNQFIYYYYREGRVLKTKIFLLSFNM